MFHNGAVLALWYQCGLPYRARSAQARDARPQDFGGKLARRVSAHAKVDAATGELLFFDYATQPPYLVHHVVSPRAASSLRSTEIEVPGPRLPHDMAITEHYSILMDLPLFWDPQLLERKVHRLGFHPSCPAASPCCRAPAARVRWFEAEPAYIYHVVNAWEEGDSIVMDACRVVDPGARPPAEGGPLGRMLATLRLDARLHRYRFDLRTGATHEEQRDDLNTEFPSIDARRMGTPTRYAYIPHIAKDAPTLLFDALVKYDTAAGTTQTHAFGPGRYCSEAPFAPRAGGHEEDDGFVVCFVHDASGGDFGGARARRAQFRGRAARDRRAAAARARGLPRLLGRRNAAAGLICFARLRLSARGLCPLARADWRRGRGYDRQVRVCAPISRIVVRRGSTRRISCDAMRLKRPGIIDGPCASFASASRATWSGSSSPGARRCERRR